MNAQLVVKNLLVNYTKVDSEKNANVCLLFLHGWRSEGKVWTSIVNKLISESANKQNCYYTIDLPGFGGSQMPPTPITVGDYADVVAEFIKKLDLKNITIVGHSFGGRVGTKLASTHPEIIARLILVDSAGFPMNQSKKNLMAMAAKLVRPLFKPKAMQGLRKKIYKHIGAEDYVATPELQQTFVNVVSEDLSQDLKRITCPTLIINGENDTDTPVEFGKKMNSLVADSKFVIIKDAGHFSFLDKPEEFVKEVSNFIK